MATVSGDESEPSAIKRRRVPKACAACRKSKVRCDERRPCSRCVNTRTECIYFAKPRDPMAERVETLEAHVVALSRRMDMASSASQPSIGAVRAGAELGLRSRSDVPGATAPSGAGGLACFTLRRVFSRDAVDRGLIGAAEALSLFNVFFEGCVASEA